MKDELQTVPAAGVPATVVNQNGEKNVHIDRADTVNQNITFNFPYVARTSDGRMQPTSRTINQNYYNLFVMGAEVQYLATLSGLKIQRCCEIL